jgi:hypothetical protein
VTAASAPSSTKKATPAKKTSKKPARRSRR